MIVNIICYFVVPIIILSLYVLLLVSTTNNSFKQDYEDDEP